MKVEKTGRILGAACVLLALLLLAGCSKASNTGDENKGIVTEQQGDIEVTMPSSSSGAGGDDTAGASEPAQGAGKPYTAAEKAAYIKVEVEFICESMTLEPEQQREMPDIAKANGLTIERMAEITKQFDAALIRQEIGTEVGKACPEALIGKSE